jgi:hypothetical protein
MAIQTVREFQATTGQYRDAQIALMAARGVGTDNIYPVQIDPITGSIAIAASAILDFGTTASASRTAAMIGGWDILPAAKATGVASGFTGTILQKAAPNDARALDTHGWLKDHTGAYRQQLGSPAGNVQVAGLVPEDFLAVSIAYPLGTQETYEYFRDAAKTVSICTITVDYADATKAQITSVVRT